MCYFKDVKIFTVTETASMFMLDEYIRKRWYIYTKEDYSAIRK